LKLRAKRRKEEKSQRGNSKYWDNSFFLLPSFDLLAKKIGRPYNRKIIPPVLNSKKL
jgi:hypothetical protein